MKKWNELEVGDVIKFRHTDKEQLGTEFISQIDRIGERYYHLSDIYHENPKYLETGWQVNRKKLQEDFDYVEYMFYMESAEEKLKKMHPELFI